MLLNARISPVLINSERLILRLPQLGDAETMAKLFRENREFLQPFYPTFEASIFTRNGWTERIRAVHEEFHIGRGVRLVLFRNDAPADAIGVANFTMIQRDPMYGCNLGYSLAESQQGQGFMTEALKPAIEYMFDQWKLHRIAANYMPSNARSGAVLTRLGFQIEGTARDYLRIDGRWEDHVCTALLNPAWNPTHGDFRRFT